VEDLVESHAVEVAGGGDADGPVGGQDVVIADLGLPLEGGLEAAEEFDLKAAEAIAVAEGEAPGLLKGLADGVDGEPIGEAEERAEDGGEEVGVFVGVKVGDVDSGALEFLYLRCGFAKDVYFADVAEKEGLEKVDERGAEGFAVGADEGGDSLGR
jgi:hypothetical protein